MVSAAAPDPTDPERPFGVRRFGRGQPVPRSEDPRLLTGRGRFTADVTLTGEVHALILRSAHGHAAIRSIDTSAALRLPGVLAVVTGADSRAEGLGDIPCAVPVADKAGRPLPRPGRPVLAGERVRFVGEPVACIVAESREIAAEACDRIVVDDEVLPAVGTIAAARAHAADAIWPDAPGNVAFYAEIGDAAAVETAFDGAAHIVEVTLVNNRVVPCALEPRSCIGTYDRATGGFTLYTGSQGAHAIRSQLARNTLKVPEDSIRVIVGDVGGGFGSKLFHYPEEALVLWLARRLGRPVKWVGERGEAFLGDTHGRAQENHIEAAFDAGGRILALRVNSRADVGAYLNLVAPANAAFGTMGMLPGVYDIPALFASCEGVYTNTVPVDAYRGAGRPEATYVIERLMDAAARRLGLAPEEIRRRNMVRAEQMPYRTATGKVFDSGDFPVVLDKALQAADRAGFDSRRAEAASRGRLRGFGLSCYVEVCGFGDETVQVRFAGDGGIEVLAGTQSTGQGHETAFAQLVADRLGVSLERIRVIQGDTAIIPSGRGTAGSRTLMIAGSAISRALDQVVDHGRDIVARLFQADPGDVVFTEGTFRVPATGQSIHITELAAAAREPDNRPGDDGREDTGSGLDASARYAMEASSFPNGCHTCEVEIDPETGETTIAGYHVVDDFGTVLNPLLLTGQVVGGVAQGIGQALMEVAEFDPDTARPVATSFATYAVPQAVDLPVVDVQFAPVPCRTNPLGIKGAGEAGAVAACPAVINAILDALAPFGVEHLDMPATPETVWRALRSAPRPSPSPSSSPSPSPSPSPEQHHDRKYQ